jgi:hypothetical protein
VDIVIYPDQIIYLRHRYVTKSNEDYSEEVDTRKLETELIIRHAEKDQILKKIDLYMVDKDHTYQKPSLRVYDDGKTALIFDN